MTDDASPEILDWFRAEPVSRTKFLLASGTVFVLLGGPAVGAAFMHALPESTRMWVSMTGAVVLLTGLVTAFGGMAMLLSHDAYLALRLDGVVLHRDKSETVIAWSDLGRVGIDERRTSLVLVRCDGSAETWHLGQLAPPLAEHIDDLRRKAASDILRANHCKFSGAR